MTPPLPEATAAQLQTALDQIQELREVWPEGASALDDRVVRPLSTLLAARVGSSGPVDDLAPRLPEDPEVSGETWHESLADLAAAVSATVGDLGTLSAPPALLEAAAGLLDLDLRVRRSRGATPDDIEDRVDELRRAQGLRRAAIRVAHNGPYLIQGAAIVDHLGVPVETPPLAALCRCGRSQDQPWCDGAHDSCGFTDELHPGRVADRRDVYVGVGITVLDNRGICAHSGVCTDTLPGVFHTSSSGQPFVTPSGGRVDDIIRVVRSCPSGALSLSLRGPVHEDREIVDQDRKAQVRITRDGPYVVVGSVPLLDDAGEPVARLRGASLEHYALCRCGHSQNKPFCSGMHWYANFTDPAAPPSPSLFEWAGGYPALLRTSTFFWEKHVPQDPVLAPLFAQMPPKLSVRLASWLSEVFGGPELYTETFDDAGTHLANVVTEEQRARWVAALVAAAEEAVLPADAAFRSAFVSYLEWESRLALEAAQSESGPAEDRAVPRWGWPCDVAPHSGSAEAEVAYVDAPAAQLPAPGEPVTFADVRSLFREMDRSTMLFAFDLWSFEDVRRHADAILARVEDGSMPCDRSWSPAEIDVFRRWLEAGLPG
ncbi:CDGSH iron-sulfur domain-containing protein [Ornithinimicrobium cryptoxanthini]|uniref:CDGSH iron-sulfur domain-containing protein n=1 Tax=Ornithinimicrobium cryptoxanthini TaxID=2934161 RepID=UPI0021179B1D|nr:CDGSH iron-sulfur domain-containing protein [Ornithinimicrobium cryptoxanthini]